MECQNLGSWILQLQCEIGEVSQVAFWIALGKIIWINIPCLSGCYPHPRHVGCCQAPE
jgi:hypothetical protein